MILQLTLGVKPWEANHGLMKTALFLSLKCGINFINCSESVVRDRFFVFVFYCNLLELFSHQE